MEDLKDGWCRVYYSTDSKLPRFSAPRSHAFFCTDPHLTSPRPPSCFSRLPVPGFAKDAIVKTASKRSTAWVNVRCNELTGAVAPVEAAPPKRRRASTTLVAALALAAALSKELGKRGISLPWGASALPDGVAAFFELLRRVRIQWPLRLAPAGDDLVGERGVEVE